MKCKYCGDEFEPVEGYEEFCTTLCIKTYRRERRRENVN